MPTARNARGVDIIAYSRDASQFRGIQIKALSKRAPTPLGTSLEKIMGDYWIIVNRVVTEPAAFVLTPAEVLERARRGEKEGQGSSAGCSRPMMSRCHFARHGNALVMTAQRQKGPARHPRSLHDLLLNSRIGNRCSRICRRQSATPRGSASIAMWPQSSMKVESQGVARTIRR